MAAHMRESMENGQFWFHELIYSYFELPDSQAWTGVRETLPNLDEPRPSDEVDIAKSNVEQLNRYNVEWAAMKREIDKKEAEFQALEERIEREYVATEEISSPSGDGNEQFPTAGASSASDLTN
ncbi:hypothetical protein BBP40_006608 [Aspergillus hancockii]|nr:hypothetical protein BBP40_006608 [Aspergillus hancockii]